jgi:hypothetical protein
MAQTDVEVVMERVGAATTELPMLIADAKTVMQHTRNPDGTVGAVLTRGMPAEFARLKQNVSALRGRGSRDPSGPDKAGVRAHATSVMARVDSIRALLASPNTSLGRFRRDSTLPGAIAQLRADLDSLERRVAGSPGTLSRLKTDSALAWAVADARREMGLLFADMKRRPLRYINF